MVNDMPGKATPVPPFAAGIELRHELRWLMRLDLSVASIPSIFETNRFTSEAHSEKPALYFERTVGSREMSAAIRLRSRSCKCRTVISRMSAFSSFEFRVGYRSKDRRKCR